jgi:hypothetical protein
MTVTTPTRKIYIVVPVFNRKRLILRFLYCMREQSFSISR